ncbi:MAG: HrpF/NolX family T3SS translocon protein, partial [Burkholderiaceae bacterium]
APAAPETAAPGGAQAQGPAAQGAPGAASTPDAATVLKGDNTGLLPKDAKCPAGVSMDDMMNANGGLLSKLGNQELKGGGAKGITGGIKDNLARMVGGKPGDIGKDPDVTYRALAALSAFKNTPGADGKPIPDDIRHNGNVSGLQPSHEVARGSTLGELQDWFKGAISGPQGQLPKGDKVNDQGVETSGAQQVGQKILKGLSDVAGFFKKAIDATIGKIPGIGKILSAPMDYVAGGLSDGLNAASLAAGGHMAEAREAGKTMAHNLLKTFSQMSAQAESLVKATVGRIPGVGKLLAAAVGDVMNLEQGAANVADTALKGGDVKGAAINMGKNAAGAWVGNAIGIVDPTGLVSGAAENGVDHALGAQSQIIQ